MNIDLPRLYAIIDAQMLAARHIALRDFALDLRAAGVTLLQYRDKRSPPQTILANAALLREVFAGSGATLLLNDRPDLAALAGLDGVHVGQTDLAPDDARRVFGQQGPDRIVGVSTHNDAQIRAADLTSADYIAIGPVFSTATKSDAEMPVGLEGVRRARALTRKPIIAIGGITFDNARSVIDAGADSVAVISALLPSAESTQHIARDFLRILR